MSMEVYLPGSTTITVHNVKFGKEENKAGKVSERRRFDELKVNNVLIIDGIRWKIDRIYALPYVYTKETHRIMMTNQTTGEKKRITVYSDDMFEVVLWQPPTNLTDTTSELKSGADALNISKEENQKSQTRAV